MNNPDKIYKHKITGVLHVVREINHKKKDKFDFYRIINLNTWDVTVMRNKKFDELFDAVDAPDGGQVVVTINLKANE